MNLPISLIYFRLLLRCQCVYVVTRNGFDVSVLWLYGRICVFLFFLLVFICFFFSVSDSGKLCNRSCFALFTIVLKLWVECVLVYFWSFSFVIVMTLILVYKCGRDVWCCWQFSYEHLYKWMLCCCCCCFTWANWKSEFDFVQMF